MDMIRRELPRRACAARLMVPGAALAIPRLSRGCLDAFCPAGDRKSFLLIDAIAVVGLFQVRAAAPVQFRPVDLDPAPDATGVDEQTTFERHLGHVRKGDRKPQVPPNAPENDIARIVTPFEGIRRGDGHVSPYQILIRFSQRYWYNGWPWFNEQSTD
jgi:hypothetical protein